MEIDTNDLKTLYDRLLKDKNFDELDLGLKNPNIFDILRISHNEIRHSNFLAWLLDPSQTHKLGDIFLKRFLREIFSSEKFAGVDQIDVEGLDLSNATIEREWKNIDILIQLDNIVVCIENKVLSKEHSNQLTKYKNIIDAQFPEFEKIFVYLNPEGDEPENETDQYEPIAYEFIVETLDRIISVYGDSMNLNVRNYINDYRKMIKRNIMKSDEITHLCRKIYSNHKELFELVLEHKPDFTEDIKPILIEEIEKRGWIIGSPGKKYLRFTTPEIKHLTYVNQKYFGWTMRESFLFEFVLNPEKDKILTKTVISPCDPQFNTHRLSEILTEIEGFQAPYGKKWLCNFLKDQKYPFSKIEYVDESTIDSIKKEFNVILDKFEPIVQKVEAQFFEYEEEIKALSK